MPGLQIVAEAVGRGLHHREAVVVGPVQRSVAAAPGERDADVVACILRRFFDRRSASQHDRVGYRQAAAQLIDLAGRPDQVVWLIDGPTLLRGEAYARAIGAAAMVGAAIVRGRRPGVLDQL